MTPIKHWLPPGKNCGLCGEKNCRSFIRMVNQQRKEYDDCPYYQEGLPKNPAEHLTEANYKKHDVLGNEYDFILQPLLGEPSARKIVLPFRGDLVEKMNIQAGDYLVGRPMGAGCPIPHVLQVIKAEAVTGLLYTWVVGPKYSRDKEIKDLVAYHMIGFEGIISNVNRVPLFGERVTFLPGFCMMNLNHTGLVNMILNKSWGQHIRIEDIRILDRANSFSPST